MEGCKANKCVKVSGLIYKGNIVNGWNGFERCSKKVYKDGFCKRCYEPDKRYKSPHVWIPDQLWRRDGIYGEPYDFPYHKTESDKEWVEMMYTLYPHLKPKEVVKEDMTLKNNTGKNHWIIRVADGKNFRNSVHPFWGMKKGRGGCIKSFFVNNVNKGDILWFSTNKKNGGKAIGMAEYTECYDREEEPLIQINTYSNKEQGWEGDDDWDLQIHYTKLYDTEKQNIQILLSGPSPIIEYKPYTENQKNIDDLYKHYEGFSFYGVSKN